MPGEGSGWSRGDDDNDDVAGPKTPLEGVEEREVKLQASPNPVI